MGKFMIGVDGVAREVKEMYIGVDGVAHKVRTGFIGVDGAARVFYGGYYQPAINETVISLNSGEYFPIDQKFAPGTYEIQIAATPGSGNYSNDNCFTVQTTVNEVFQIFAVASAGTDATTYITDTLGMSDTAGTIFGGHGGKSAGISISGGSYAVPQNGSLFGGAVCHFIPVGGTFGTDYLRCFHCGVAASAVYGGSGAYGGGAGGRGARTYNTISRQYSNVTGATGKSGAGGSGGTGGTGTTSGSAGAGDSGKPGNSGSGTGAGTATKGGVAWYNGSSWTSPTRVANTTGNAFVRIIYKARLQ